MRALTFIFSLFCTLHVRAEGLQLAMPFTDHCVLQRYQPICVEGRAAAGETVTVILGESNATAKAGLDGKWQAMLPPMKEAVGLTLTVASGDESISCQDVAIGEVWLASGQSNMAFRLDQAIGGSEEIARSADPLLRFLDMKPRYETISGAWSDEACAQVDNHDYYIPASWHESTPQTSALMSAIGYYFGRQLRDSLQVPVGIINNSIGGAPTEAWMDMGTLRAFVPEVLDDWQHNGLIQDWVRGRASENIAGDNRHQHPYKPAYLFDTGIASLAHYTIAGVVWYQGESNAHNTVLHERLFELLVHSWRDYWHRPSLPFAFVQLSSMARPTWPGFRDSQRRLQQRIPMTGMAVSSDVGDSLDVHPRLKRPVGERLARWALHNVYSRADVVPSGPSPLVCVAIGHNTVCLKMQYAAGMHTADGKPLRTFELAAPDGVFYPAAASVHGDEIIINSDVVDSPRFVRYAWQPFTRANLVNGDNLPASTFCIMIDDYKDNNDGYAQGVSAAFAGQSNGCDIVAGGCNFPDNPLGKDSRKVTYDGIYRVCDGELHRVGRLPHPVAYGMSATTPDGIVMAGGTGSRDVWLVNMKDGEAVVDVLPPLPCAIDNAAACAIANNVYVAGGNHDGKPSNAMLCYDGKKWNTLPPFPGNPRTQPVMASGCNAKGEVCLWLFGGFAAQGEASTLETDGLVYIPSKKKWMTVPGPTDERGEALSVGGGCAATLHDGRIVVTGGVNKDIFLSALRHPAPDYLSHPVEWYRFNDAVMLFDPATGQWQLANHDLDTARAGAVIIAHEDGSLMLYGGELKPRIRTPHIHTGIKTR